LVANYDFRWAAPFTDSDDAIVDWQRIFAFTKRESPADDRCQTSQTPFSPNEMAIMSWLEGIQVPNAAAYSREIISGGHFQDLKVSHTSNFISDFFRD
jgi:hypothetical protein